MSHPTRCCQAASRLIRGLTARYGVGSLSVVAATKLVKAAYALVVVRPASIGPSVVRARLSRTVLPFSTAGYDTQVTPINCHPSTPLDATRGPVHP